ncbi:MAG: DNA cytosine methyltransferase [Verrucomicrobia bacterium]|nr:DNA cytosine methyltransferase [Verrucomicrobiota bacterium]
MWPHIADGIAACEPSAVFFENVQGHVTLGLRDVLCDLGRMGYRTTWGMFSAAEVGAPHQRKRVFILGWLPDSCGRRLMDAVQRSQCEAGVETREPARGGCGELADTAGQRDRKSSEGIPVGNQRLPRRQEGSADVGGRVQEELADAEGQRREGWQPEPDLQARGAVEGTGNEEGELADTDNCRGGKDQQPAQLWPEGVKQSPGDSGGYGARKAGQVQKWPSRPGQAQYDWEEPRTVANTKGG